MLHDIMRHSNHFTSGESLLQSKKSSVHFGRVHRDLNIWRTYVASTPNQPPIVQRQLSQHSEEEPFKLTHEDIKEINHYFTFNIEKQELHNRNEIPEFEKVNLRKSYAPGVIQKEVNLQKTPYSVKAAMRMLNMLDEAGMMGQNGLTRPSEFARISGVARQTGMGRLSSLARQTGVTRPSAFQKALGFNEFSVMSEISTDSQETFDAEEELEEVISRLSQKPLHGQAEDLIKALLAVGKDPEFGVCCTKDGVMCLAPPAGWEKYENKEAMLNRKDRPTFQYMPRSPNRRLTYGFRSRQVARDPREDDKPKGISRKELQDIADNMRKHDPYESLRNDQRERGEHQYFLENPGLRTLTSPRTFSTDDLRRYFGGRSRSVVNISYNDLEDETMDDIKEEEIHTKLEDKRALKKQKTLKKLPVSPETEKKPSSPKKRRGSVLINKETARRGSVSHPAPIDTTIKGSTEPDSPGSPDTKKTPTDKKINKTPKGKERAKIKGESPKGKNKRHSLLSPRVPPKDQKSISQDTYRNTELENSDNFVINNVEDNGHTNIEHQLLKTVDTKIELEEEGQKNQTVPEDDKNGPTGADSDLWATFMSVDDVSGHGSKKNDGSRENEDGTNVDVQDRQWRRRETNMLQSIQSWPQLLLDRQSSISRCYSWPFFEMEPYSKYAKTFSKQKESPQNELNDALALRHRQVDDRKPSHSLPFMKDKSLMQRLMEKPLANPVDDGNVDDKNKGKDLSEADSSEDEGGFLSEDHVSEDLEPETSEKSNVSEYVVSNVRTDIPEPAPVPDVDPNICIVRPIRLDRHATLEQLDSTTVLFRTASEHKLKEKTPEPVRAAIRPEKEVPANVRVEQNKNIRPRTTNDEKQRPKIVVPLDKSRPSSANPVSAHRSIVVSRAVSGGGGHKYQQIVHVHGPRTPHAYDARPQTVPIKKCDNSIEQTMEKKEPVPDTTPYGYWDNYAPPTTTEDARDIIFEVPKWVKTMHKKCDEKNLSETLPSTKKSIFSPSSKPYFSRQTHVHPINSRITRQFDIKGYIGQSGEQEYQSYDRYSREGHNDVIGRDYLLQHLRTPQTIGKKHKSLLQQAMELERPMTQGSNGRRPHSPLRKVSKMYNSHETQVHGANRVIGPTRDMLRTPLSFRDTRNPLAKYNKEFK